MSMRVMLNVEEHDICHRKQKCCCVVQQRSDGKWCMQIQMTNKHQICVMEDAVITNLIHPLYISMMHAEISIFTLASGFACRNVTDIQNLLWSSGEGQARVGKEWQSRQKASKLKAEPRAYIKIGLPPSTRTFNFTQLMAWSSSGEVGGGKGRYVESLWVTFGSLWVTLGSL